MSLYTITCQSRNRFSGGEFEDSDLDWFDGWNLKRNLKDKEEEVDENESENETTDYR